MSNKSDDVKIFLDNVSSIMFGNKRTEAIENGHCVSCGNGIPGFRDELSEKEYKISGFCQSCQDEIFPPNNSKE